LPHQVGRGAAQVALGLRDVERHEELTGAIRLTGGLALIHVGRERREALGGESIAGALDVADGPPPFLDAERPPALARGRRGQVSGGFATVRRELDHASRHVQSPYGVLVPATGRVIAVTGVIFTEITRRASDSSTVIEYPAI